MTKEISMRLWKRCTLLTGKLREKKMIQNFPTACRYEAMSSGCSEGGKEKNGVISRFLFILSAKYANFSGCEEEKFDYLATFHKLWNSSLRLIRKNKVFFPPLWKIITHRGDDFYYPSVRNINYLRDQTPKSRNIFGGRGWTEWFSRGRGGLTKARLYVPK